MRRLLTKVHKTLVSDADLSAIGRSAVTRVWGVWPMPGKS
jgi:hypothetical protein